MTSSAAPLNTLFAPHRFYDEHVFLTKLPQYGVVFKLRGIDYECLSLETLETYSSRLASAFRTLDEDFRIYQYLVKHDGAEIDTDVSALSTVAADTVRKRNEFLKSKQPGLFSIELYLVILYEPEVVKRRFQTTKAKRIEAARVRRNAEYLLTRARSFQRTITDLLAPELLGKEDAFQFFRQLANPDKRIAQADKLRYDNHLDHWMGSSVVSCAADGIGIDYEHVQVLTLREPPRNTFPHLLRDFLKLEANFILCSEFKREPNDTAIKAINAAENHFHHTQTIKNFASILAMGIAKAMGGGSGKEDIVPDAAATANVDELKSSAVRINEGEYMGQYSLTAILHSPDSVRLRGAVADAMKIVGSKEGSLIRETYNALNAYRAMIPGNQPHNFRQMWMLSRNFVDLALVYAPHSGEKTNNHLNAPHLITLETTDQTPFSFNLHESDLLGVLLFGIMGSGKSFTTNLFIDHTQQYDPFTFILDVGGSYRQITRKHGGSYVHMQFGQQDFRINPFSLDPQSRTRDDLQFLFSFVRVLLTNSGYSPSPKEDQALYEAIKAARRLGELELPESLMPCLQAWIGDGRYGMLFDNAQDTLEIAKFQAFDFQGLELYPQILEPLLFYIFQRISAIVYDPVNRDSFKQLWADEVWRFLANPTAKQYFISAGKTWRKHNGGIGLITQSVGDLEKAGLLDLVNEICPTKILLANPGADKRFYQRTFDMNDREVELLAGLIPKKQILVKTPLRSTVLNIDVDPYASWLYRNDPRGNALRDAAIAAHGFEKGLEILAEAG